MNQTTVDRIIPAPRSANEAVTSWLHSFADAVAANDVESVVDTFADDSWWRDLVSMSWDLQTLHGSDEMRPFLQDHLKASGIGNFALWDEAEPTYSATGDGGQTVEAFLTFRTAVGWGIAVVRLVDIDGHWKAYTLMTALQELDGRELTVGANRPIGERIPTRPWSAHREEVLAFEEEPDVVILGAGHAGMSAAAYLQFMGINALALEKNASVGDVWRNRYDPLVLHDPIWLDQLPFMPFPDSWPVYSPKDKLADWFEVYAKSLDLNVWTSTELTSATYSAEDERWTVQVQRGDGTARTLRPRHFVLATGIMTKPKIPTFEGQDDFGGTIVHTTEHRSGRDWTGKKAIVVGTGNSGNDVAKDLCDHGADTTMVQRSATYVMTQKYSQSYINGPHYSADGPGVQIADLRQIATPFGQMMQLAPAITRHMGELDREVTDGLRAAGFLVDDGSESGGLVGLGLGAAGGYLIDVGSAQYIIDGKISITTGEIRRFVPEGLEMADGTILEADLVVMATGFENMVETARDVLGDDVADACGQVWGLDDGNELHSMWRPSGFPHLWFSGGSFPYSRIYNRFLGLQIAADFDGLT